MEIATHRICIEKSQTDSVCLVFPSPQVPFLLFVSPWLRYILLHQGTFELPTMRKVACIIQFKKIHCHIYFTLKRDCRIAYYNYLYIYVSYFRSQGTVIQHISGSLFFVLIVGRRLSIFSWFSLWHQSPTADWLTRNSNNVLKWDRWDLADSQSLKVLGNRKYDYKYIPPLI